MKLEPVIGLEIHVQLKTKSKMFCPCARGEEGAEPNTNVCPVCMGHPGTLPVPNRQAIRWTVMAGLALNCEVSKHSKFDRKSYFYPDLPKGYQISQFDLPICNKGHLEVEVDGKKKKIRLTRIHLEEDAGKLIHPEGSNHSLVDFNRAGTPLMEIVSEPDIRSPKEAKLFLQELRILMRYLRVSDADMEKGQLRCDANISLRAVGSSDMNPKTEIKNMNSFRAIERALDYEIKRQTELWESGEGVNEETTRGWSESGQITEAQRSKEEAADYRYFPEPDIPPLEFSKDDIEEIKAKVPELPEQKIERFTSEYGLDIKDAKSLSEDARVAEYYEETVSELKEWLSSTGVKEKEMVKVSKKITKLAANWILSELFGLMKKEDRTITDIKINPENFAELITMVFEDKINSSAAQEVLKVMYDKGSDPSHVIEEQNLAQVSDAGELEKIAKDVIDNNPKPVEEYKAGKDNAIQFLVGQVMKESKGKANPRVAREVLEKLLK